VPPQPPRSCEDYWWEWKHCRGLRHAFHHYYVHGELPACGRWRDDYEACRAWERGRAAAAQVPPAPQQGRRLPLSRPGAAGGKYAPVWTLRKSPPPDWYLPLEQDKSN
ncbi:CV039 protein, partial [Syrrhaptes paradoxus]|nr:CV039 protein [Syrrhaptes paradoxus]